MKSVYSVYSETSLIRTIKLCYRMSDFGGSNKVKSSWCTK